MLTRPEERGLYGGANGEHGRGRVMQPSPALSVCPFARRGLDSPAMPRCPGYAAVAVSFTGMGAGESLGERTTCIHLGTQRSARGFRSACRHPDGLPAGAETISGRLERRTPAGGARLVAL